MIARHPPRLLPGAGLLLEVGPPDEDGVDAGVGRHRQRLARRAIVAPPDVGGPRARLRDGAGGDGHRHGVPAEHLHVHADAHLPLELRLPLPTRLAAQRQVLLERGPAPLGLLLLGLDPPLEQRLRYLDLLLLGGGEKHAPSDHVDRPRVDQGPELPLVHGAARGQSGLVLGLDPAEGDDLAIHPGQDPVLVEELLLGGGLGPQVEGLVGVRVDRGAGPLDGDLRGLALAAREQREEAQEGERACGRRHPHQSRSAYARC